MSSFQYLDKRINGNSGEILRFSSYRLSYDASYKCFDLIKNYKTYSKLTNILPKDLVSMYFMKLFYFEFLNIAHQIKIREWDNEYNKKNYIRFIDTSYFSCMPILKKLLTDYNIDKDINIHFFNLKRIFINIIIRLYRFIKKYINICFYFALSSNYKDRYSLSNTQDVIAVNYVEGVEAIKKSDLFWLEESGVDPSSVLLYFEHDSLLNKHTSKKQLIKLLENYGVNWIYMWKMNQKYNNKYYFNKFNKILNKDYLEDGIERWLYTQSINLLQEVDYWYSFFKNNNIKIHLDPTEVSTKNIIKQIALKFLNGCSIGKMRSYPHKLKEGCFFGYYPNDVFFTWGIDSSLLVQDTTNQIGNIVISGYPYFHNSPNKESKINNIKKDFLSQGVKLTLLILDNNHSLNKNIEQLIPTHVLESFYKSFLNLLIEDQEIGLIIKSKKPIVIDTLKSIENDLKKAKTTGRCYVVENSFQTIPINYSLIADFSLATGTYFSSALMECISFGAKGIFYDYPNLKSIEFDLYKWGEGKILFSNLKNIISSLKKYKNNPNSMKELGNWKQHIHKVDPFRDGRGGERIGTYIRHLLDSYGKGSESNIAINYANQQYIKKWGKDKVIVQSL